MNQVDLYPDNAEQMWSSLGEVNTVADAVLAITRPGSVRYLVRHPSPPDCVAALTRAAPLSGRAVVEDPYSARPVTTPATVTVLRMPVMNRPPAPLTSTHREDVTVTQVSDPDTLAAAERVIVDGFPHRPLQPYIRGQALPPRVLQLPGWNVWLAHHRGTPAAACYTYDDGTAVGIYWLATMPAHRRAGLGKALMTTALRAHPHRSATLTATQDGLPLYTVLGFTTVGTATWYIQDQSFGGR